LTHSRLVCLDGLKWFETKSIEKDALQSAAST
jgi:hypothetical protein